MLLKNMITQDTIFLDLEANSQKELIDIIAEKLLIIKLIKNKEKFIKEIINRENQESTAIGDGIAIPHILNSTVNESRIIIVRLKNSLDWNAFDNKKVNLVFFIITNGVDGNEHLEALGELSKFLIKKENILSLNEIKSAKKIENLFNDYSISVKENTISSKSENYYDVVGITACPTGIAHTYLAQEKIIDYAKSLELTAKVETQGRRGTEFKLSQEEINNAKVIFLAHDKAITGMDRFNNKKVIETGTKNAIFKGKEIIENALKGENLKTIHANTKDGDSELSLKKFKDIKGNLLAGVSRMLPFVVAGGIVLGIAFLIDFAAGSKGGSDFGTTNKVAGWFAALGKLSMSLMIPILGAYITYSIVGPQGLMPGMIAGLTSSNIMSFAYGSNNDWSNMWGKLLPFESHESGFIGAIFGAYLAAFIVFGWTKAFEKLPKSLQGARDIVFIPILSILSIGITMFIINIPIGYLMMELSEGIKWLANNNLILLVSALFGIMMCFDMGGPINKIAYSLGVLAVAGQLVKDGNNPATGALLGQQQILMAAALLAGMLPPLMIALCTIIFPRAWTAKDRDAAKVNWVMGLCFVTEGAIPFMIKDPKRISVSAMIGGLFVGLTTGLFKLSVGAPHGGIFVFALMKTGINNPNYDLTASSIGIGIILAFGILIIGTIISSLILGFWRTHDIKKGSFVLDETNGLKEKYQNKLISLNDKLNLQKPNHNKMEKQIEKLNIKINAYNDYEKNLKTKQKLYAEKINHKNKK
ncbi:fructose-specific PTS transporter subunit EIIC [Spiroplasma endosymbiont of Labia minor]|uniref:PTS fructose transporter subunit IIABC n=1 Tax=Spiroplasma endosymbiont of Labia minor TaxID=3066305 RepID=UPI0030CAF473